MPKITKPTSDAARLTLLNHCSAAVKSDEAMGIAYLYAPTVSALHALIPVFHSKLMDETGKLAARSKEVREKNESLLLLIVYIRDMWEMIKRRVKRQSEPAEVLTYYSLPLDGTVPQKITHEVGFMLAEKMIEGDRKAVEAGYQPAVCPSANELAHVLAAAQKEFDEVTPADRAYAQAQEALTPIRTQVDDLIDDMISDLEYNLRKMEDSSRRRIMRTYGISFTYLASETTEEAEDTAAVSTPPSK